MNNFKRLIILIVILGFVGIAWIKPIYVSQIVDFDSEVDALISAETELIYFDGAEADTHATVIITQGVKTNIATTLRSYESNKFTLSDDSLKLRYTGDDSIVAHVIVDISVQETDGSSERVNLFDS